MKTQRNYHQDLNTLICDMTSLRRYSETTMRGSRMVVLTEGNGSTLWRWCPVDGFIYCGEMPRA